MKANGLTLKEIRSHAESLQISDLPSLENLLAAEEYYVVAWFDYAVRFGTYNQGQWVFSESHGLELKFLQRLRVFNLQKELHIWRTHNQFKGRLREDGQGQSTEIVEAQQILFGTRAQPIGEGYTRISEDLRGIHLDLPVTNLKADNTRQRIRILTRNYIGYTAMNQAEYQDSRFVELGEYREE